MVRTIHETTEDTGNAVAARFLRAAGLCRMRDLEQLSVLGELVRKLSALIHALQKERGAASIFLGSNGAQFAERLTRRITECRALELAVREHLEHVDDKLDRMSSGARFYTRVALALGALDSLPLLRKQINALVIAPQDSVRALTVLIGRLLAVGFEVGDIAADPEVCRVLVALVNLAQAKEYAGQERATVGAAVSSGNAQDEAFRIFIEFADSTHIDAFNALLAGRDTQEVERLRQLISRIASGEAVGATVDGAGTGTPRDASMLCMPSKMRCRASSAVCAASSSRRRPSAARIPSRVTPMIFPQPARWACCWPKRSRRAAIPAWRPESVFILSKIQARSRCVRSCT
ncbi:MAG TPA: nitrate- and nitrite sensing domain-containing protein [Steroidobacteraceae bacterium]|nr:nitrate- and nitrite sensing domain-containing protein [Steroidobacteraceae bacterium]